MTTHNVGKVNLNLINCDKSLDEIEAIMPADERKLFSYIRDCAEIEYPSIIERENSYYFLKSLSPIRENIVRWLPIKRSDRVLEINSETGAVSAGIVKMSQDVTLVENSLTNGRILAERFRDCNKLTIYCNGINESLKEIAENNHKFNWIITQDINCIEACKKLICEDGHIVFACDNRLGLKFLAGNKLEGDSAYFSGLEGKNNLSYSLSYLKDIMKETMIFDYNVYYPYPDYRFMKNLYSDRHLPSVGELVLNDSNYQDDCLKLFSEKDAFDAAVKDGTFAEIANSFVIIAGPELDTEYARFSNDRSEEHIIYTSIDKKGNSHVVRKHALSNAAYNHIKGLYDSYVRLNERYLGSELNVNMCTMVDIDGEPVASFEYVEGIPLSELMDDCLSKDDLDGFYDLFKKYYTLLSFNDDSDIADMDVVFSNILINDNMWTLIDYEWCKRQNIPAREIAYRAVYCYLLEDEKREKINLDLIREILGLSKAASDEIENDEIKFQQFVTGKNKSLAELREAMGRKRINPIPIVTMINDNKDMYVYQVYPSDHAGNFSEDNSYFINDAYKSDHITESIVVINANDLCVRIDPINSESIITILECRINELDYPVENKKYLVSNGRRINDNSFVFDTNDPNLIFNLSGLVHEENSFLYLKCEITRIDATVAKALCDKPKITDYLRK